jgi:hypothetical protein
LRSVTPVRHPAVRRCVRCGSQRMRCTSHVARDSLVDVDVLVISGLYARGTLCSVQALASDARMRIETDAPPEGERTRLWDALRLLLHSTRPRAPSSSGPERQLVWETVDSIQNGCGFERTRTAGSHDNCATPSAMTGTLSFFRLNAKFVLGVQSARAHMHAAARSAAALGMSSFRLCPDGIEESAALGCLDRTLSRHSEDRHSEDEFRGA